MDKEKAPRRVLSRLTVFLADVEKSYGRGAEDNVGKKLKYEIESNEEDDKISADGHSLSCGSGVDCIHEESEATEKEDARVDNGANDRRNGDGKVAIFLFKKLIHKTRAQACKNTLYHNGDNGSGDAETHPEGGICRHKEDDTGNTAKPSARKRTAQGRT